MRWFTTAIRSIALERIFRRRGIVERSPWFSAAKAASATS
jgi:hypothetical protein